MGRTTSSFTGNVLKLISGNVAAQGLGILLAPVTARLFAPEAYGVAAIFASITTVIGVVACFRYELSIMLPKTDEEAANLFGLCLCFVIVTTLCSAIAVWVAGNEIVRVLKSPELKDYLWLVPVSVFCGGIFTALNHWNTRRKDFGRLSLAQIIASVTAQGFKLGLGFAGYVRGGTIIVASVLGGAVSTSLLGVQVWKDDRHRLAGSINLQGLIAGLKRYKKFPLFGSWSGLLNVASVQMPAWILAYYFSPKVVGFYSLGKTMLSVPVGLIGGAVGQVFFQRAAEAHSHGHDLDRVVKEVFRRLVSFGVFPAAMLSLIGEDIFMVAFGARWAEAGIYMQILSCWLFFVFISSPMNSLFSVLEFQRVGLIFNIILFSTRALTLIAGGLSGNIYVALSLFSIAGTGGFLWMCLWLMARAQVPTVQALGIIAKYAGYSLSLLAVPAFVKWGLSAGPLWVLVAGSVMALPYYAVIVRGDKAFHDQLRLAVRRVRGRD